MRIVVVPRRDSCRIKRENSKETLTLIVVCVSVCDVCVCVGVQEVRNQHRVSFFRMLLTLAWGGFSHWLGACQVG